MPRKSNWARVPKEQKPRSPITRSPFSKSAIRTCPFVLFDAAAYLRTRLRVPAGVAAEIARASTNNALGFDGVNMRQAVEAAQSWLAERSLEDAA